MRFGGSVTMDSCSLYNKYAGIILGIRAKELETRKY